VLHDDVGHVSTTRSGIGRDCRCCIILVAGTPHSDIVVIECVVF
jgi:hypothetical protein